MKEKCRIQYQQMKIIKVSPMNDIENKLTNSSVVKYSKVLFSGGVFIIDNELQLFLLISFAFSVYLLFSARSLLRLSRKVRNRENRR